MGRPGHGLRQDHKEADGVRGAVTVGGAVFTPDVHGGVTGFSSLKGRKDKQ